MPPSIRELAWASRDGGDSFLKAAREGRFPARVPSRSLLAPHFLINVPLIKWNQIAKPGVNVGEVCVHRRREWFVASYSHTVPCWSQWWLALGTSQVQRAVGFDSRKPKGQGLPWWLGKEFACQCRRCGFYPWIRNGHWGRKWQPTPVFLPGESHRQRSLLGCSP